MSPGTTGVFTVRRMTPADKPAMMEIASRIWEGSDYLPAVFDDCMGALDHEAAPERNLGLIQRAERTVRWTTEFGAASD